MKNNAILIAVVCGLISALLFLSSRSLGGIGVALSTFTALPLFVSALGFGTVAGIISGLAATLVVGLYFGFIGALIVAVATVAPAIWIGHSAGLSRDDSGEEEWFPLSQILLRLAMIAAITTIAVGVVIGYSTEWAAEQMTQLISEFTKIQAATGDPSLALTPEQISNRATSMAQVLPFMMPVSILLLLVVNLRLAERVVRSQGWMKRPKDDLPSQVQLPPYSVSIFAISLGLSFIGGGIGSIGMAIAGAFCGVFILVGLASVHFLTKGVTARGVILGLTWAALLFSIIMGPVLAAIGVAETLFQFRNRMSARRTGP